MLTCYNAQAVRFSQFPFSARETQVSLRRPSSPIKSSFTFKAETLRQTQQDHLSDVRFYLSEISAASHIKSLPLRYD
ncbi:hypothetical protein PANPA_00138 (plasmid) [Pantoea sp. Nvir]|nr:hypothetical protein C3408_17355 [Pantoea alvi]